MTLTWSAVICTLNRPQLLKAAVESILRQSQLPKQIIIIDASEYWNTTKQSILADCQDAQLPIEWIYEASTVRSSAVQRNQGLAYCDADVVFFVDDDSMLYTDCARAVMDVYQADPSLAIGGVTTMLSGDIPSEMSLNKADLGATNTDYQPGRRNFNDLVARLWYQHELFLPYDGTYHSPRPEDIAHIPHVVGASLFHGCRMSFRTELVKQLGGCNDTLIRYSAGEDCDLSYRISQKKFLVVAQNAWIYHAQSSSQRMDRKSNSALVLANSIAMYLMNIQKQGWSSSLTIYRFILKRLVLEVLRDLSKRRLDMPCAKGAFFTLKLVPKLLQMPVPELKRLYPNIQASIFALR